MTTNTRPHHSTRVLATELRDGDRIFVSGRWTTITNLHTSQFGSVAARTDDDCDLFMGPEYFFDVAR